MKIDKMIDKMKDYKVPLPEHGTGPFGRILAVDLENALGEYFLSEKYMNNVDRKIHCMFRRRYRPMKAYRYDKLSEEDKLVVLEDNSKWIAEQKYNGWRIMITYLPKSGFCFWGGNISDVDFLPVDYTDHVLINDKSPGHEDFLGLSKLPYLIDAEVICKDDVEGADGLFSSNTLDAVGIILGSLPERAHELQKTGSTLLFKCFDLLLHPNMTNYADDYNPSLECRKKLLHQKLENIMSTQFQETEPVTINKKQFLHHLWNKGEEGIILKNLEKPYVSSGRLRTHAIKVKRTMSGEIGDDIDAWISGFATTEEWDKQCLIGTIELSVNIKSGMETTEHVIASVSGMPLEMRKSISSDPNHYIGKVVVVDGQELSSRNKKLMHARVDWSRGFRKDKTTEECIIELEHLEEEKF